MASEVFVSKKYLRVFESNCSNPVKAVSLLNVLGGNASSSKEYSIKGSLKGKLNFPTPKLTVNTIIAIAIAVKGRTLIFNSIPSFPIILFHQLLIYVIGLLTLTSIKGFSSFLKSGFSFFTVNTLDFIKGSLLSMGVSTIIQFNII
jgi:hypothetical protein